MVRGVWPLTGKEGQVKQLLAVGPQLWSRHHSVDSPSSSQVQDKQGILLMFSQSVSSILLCLKARPYNSDTLLQFVSQRARQDEATALSLGLGHLPGDGLASTGGCCGLMYIKHTLHVH